MEDVEDVEDAEYAQSLLRIPSEACALDRSLNCPSCGRASFAPDLRAPSPAQLWRLSEHPSSFGGPRCSSHTVIRLPGLVICNGFIPSFLSQCPHPQFPGWQSFNNSVNFEFALDAFAAICCTPSPSEISSTCD